MLLTTTCMYDSMYTNRKQFGHLSLNANNFSSSESTVMLGLSQCLKQHFIKRSIKSKKCFHYFLSKESTKKSFSFNTWYTYLEKNKN